jgi:hypothetical protein
MVDLKRATFFLVAARTCFLVIATGSSMARIAVMRVAVTEPESNLATVATLEVNVLRTVPVTVLDSCPNRLS